MLVLLFRHIPLVEVETRRLRSLNESVLSVAYELRFSRLGCSRVLSNVELQSWIVSRTVVVRRGRISVTDRCGNPCRRLHDPPLP